MGPERIAARQYGDTTASVEVAVAVLDMMSQVTPPSRLYITALHGTLTIGLKSPINPPANENAICTALNPFDTPNAPKAHLAATHHSFVGGRHRSRHSRAGARSRAIATEYCLHLACGAEAALYRAVDELMPAIGGD